MKFQAAAASANRGGNIPALNAAGARRYTPHFSSCGFFFLPISWYRGGPMVSDLPPAERNWIFLDFLNPPSLGSGQAISSREALPPPPPLFPFRPSGGIKCFFVPSFSLHPSYSLHLFWAERWKWISSEWRERYWVSFHLNNFKLLHLFPPGKSL